MTRRFLALALLLPLFAVACAGGRPVANTMDDATITARVKTVLLNDPQVNATKIDVSTSNGVVVMSGQVRSKAEEERAIQLARQVSGVKDVKANLTVVGSAPDPDVTILRS